MRQRFLLNRQYDDICYGTRHQIMRRIHPLLKVHKRISWCEPTCRGTVLAEPRTPRG